MSFDREKTTETKAPLCAILRKPSRDRRVPGLECPSGLSNISDVELDDLIDEFKSPNQVVTILVRRTKGGPQQILEVFLTQDGAAKYIETYFFDLWPEPIEVCQFCCCPEKIEAVRWAYASSDLNLLINTLDVPLSFFFSLVIREVIPE